MFCYCDDDGSRNFSGGLAVRIDVQLCSVVVLPALCKQLLHSFQRIRLQQWSPSRPASQSVDCLVWIYFQPDLDSVAQLIAQQPTATGRKHETDLKS